MDDIKSYLDFLVEKYNVPSFIDDDPVQFPRRYDDRRDVEVVAFLIATIAWGRRPMILRDSERLLDMMGKSPFDFVMSGGGLKIDPDKNIHRTFFARDLLYFCNGFKMAYSQYDSLEDVFAFDGKHNVWEGISRFRTIMADANNGATSVQVSNPDGSACKRLHLALRWLVRNDGIVDIGIWKKIKPSDLMIPLDVHVADTSRRLGLTTRKGNDRKTVEEITAALSRFDSSDPVKYDFALFGAGIEKTDNQ